MVRKVSTEAKIFAKVAQLANTWLTEDLGSASLAYCQHASLTPPLIASVEVASK